MDILGLAPPLTYSVECRDASGRLKWREEIHNLVTTEGKNHLGNVYFRGTTPVTTWYVGLKQSGTIAAGDTAASHAGWSDFTSYNESVRQTLTLSAFSSGASSNSGSPAVFTINASGTVAGAFVVSNSSKTGNTGTLYSVADFSAAQTVAAADVLTITVSVT